MFVLGNYNKNIYEFGLLKKGILGKAVCTESEELLTAQSFE